MEVTYDRDPNGRTTFRVVVPPDRVDEAYQRALRELKRRVTVPGFRPGKVPPKLVESIIGPKPIADFAKDLLRDSVLPEALAMVPELVSLDDEEPELELEELRRGEPCTLTAQLTCAKVALAEYKGVEVEQYRAAVDEAAARDQIDREYREYAQRHSSDHEQVQEGDEVEFALRIVRDGVLMEDFPPDDPLRIELGNNDLNPNIDDHLLGCRPGDYKVFEVTYPEDYANEELAGATAEFAVEVQAIVEREPLETFLSRTSPYSTLEEAVAGVRAELEQRRNGTFRILAREKVVRAVVEASQLEIPPSRLEAEIQEEIDEFEEQLEDRGVDLDAIEDQLEVEYDRIRERVTYDMRRSVTLRAIAQHEQIEVEQDDLMHELTLLSHANQVDPRLLVRRLDDQGQMAAVARGARLRKTAEQLLAWAKVTEVEPPDETAEDEPEVDEGGAASVEAVIGEAEDALEAVDSLSDEPEDEPCP